MKALSRLLIAAVVLATGTGTGRAQQKSLIEPEPMAALTRMGGYLRSLKAFRVDADTSDEDVLVNGQKVQFGGVTKKVYGFAPLRYQWELAGRTTTEGAAWNIAFVFPLKPIPIP